MRAPMLKVLIAAVAGLATLAIAVAQPAPKPASRTVAPPRAPVVRLGDAVAGKEKAAAERCIECHGQQGQGQGHSNGPEGKFAKLSGQFPDYLLKQLNDFRSGKRKHDVMQMMARSVEPDDLLDIVAYFAAQPRMQGEGQGAGHATGRALYAQGDAARQIVPCASCHGEAGLGTPAGPVLAGQELRYLEQQLLDWRHGFRNNSADGVMSQATKSLTDKEVTELANYLASQQPSPP